MSQTQTEILDLLHRKSQLQSDSCLLKANEFYIDLPDHLHFVGFHSDGTLTSISEAAIVFRLLLLLLSTYEDDCPMWLSPPLKGGEWRASPLGCPSAKMSQSPSPLLPLLSALVEWLEQEQRRKKEWAKTGRTVAEAIEALPEFDRA